MSQVRVIGVYDMDHARRAVHAKARRGAIQAHCRAQKLPEPSFDSVGFFEATVSACELANAGHQVILCGHISDLHVPSEVLEKHGAEAFTDHEWQAAWLAYLNDRAIGWSPISSTSTQDASESSRQSVIRSYQRSCAALAQVMARIRSRRKVKARSKELGYTYGRPPYGYRVVGGHLLPDDERTDLVKEAFRLLRSGMTITAVAEQLGKLAMGRDGKAEYWDPVKVRRLIHHAPLYCKGEYTSPAGQTMCLPSLAILEPAWIDVLTTRGSRPVPKPAGSGTLGASSPSTR